VEPGQTAGPVPVVVESARRTSPVWTSRPRNDSIIASVAGAHRAQMTGWSNVVRAEWRRSCTHWQPGGTNAPLRRGRPPH